MKCWHKKNQQWQTFDKWNRVECQMKGVLKKNPISMKTSHIYGKTMEPNANISKRKNCIEIKAICFWQKSKESIDISKKQ